MPEKYKGKEVPQKYISEFVKKHKALNARNVMRLLWDSTNNGTYIKKKHGKLI